MRSKLNKESDIVVDLAPLIDCVFLLLIFFLVATTMKKIDRELPVDLPDATMAIETKTPEQAVVVGVDRDGMLYLDAEPATASELLAALQNAAATTPQPPVRIDADRYAHYEAVLHVLDECSYYGLKNVSFHLRKDKEAWKR